jgi:hypothetical protein
MARFKSTVRIGGDQSRTQIHAKRRTAESFTRSTPPGGLRARGRRGESLASARDRQRLRERNRSERERVEGMIASQPIPVERRAHGREALASEYKPLAASFGLRAAQAGCPICGDGRIVTDEVMHGGTLRVSECLHCEHRWTQRPKERWVELGRRMNRSARPRAIHAVESASGFRPRRGTRRRAGHRTAEETALPG